MKRLILFLALTIAELNLNIKAVVINGLSYTLGTDEAMLDNDNGNWDGELVIPSEVEYEGKRYTVTEIAWLAFDHCTTLTKVTIPHTVTDIWHYAGYDDCKNPFDGCVNLEVIEVEEDNPSMCSIDGVLYSKDCTKLYAYPGGAKRESFIVPESVTWVGGDAFSRNPYLKAVEIPHNVSSCFGTFTDCSALEQVILPEDLTYITYSMFRNCTSLKSIKIPSGVKKMHEQAFYGCASLTSVSLPKGLTEVGSLTFMNCSSLQSINLPSTLSVITDGMFSGCSALHDVVIPKGVKRISMSAFNGCTSLKILDLPETLTWLDNCLFNGCEMDALVIRGQISNIFRYTFKDLSEATVIYALDITKITEVYGGKVLPLSQYKPGSIPNSTYHPFIEEGKVWHFEGSNPSSAPEYYCKWEKTYSLEGDTVIGTFQCKKLYVTSNCPFKIMKDWYYGAFFEDGAQVFYIPANSTTPHLLYDFSCREGDNVIIDWNELMIQERFFVQLNGSAHVVIKWVPKEMDEYQSLWIEGIGDTRGLLEYLGSWNPGSEYYKLLSCEVKGKVIFDAQTFKEALSANDSTDISNSTYRPFIEDGKVWRTGINPGSGFVKCYEYRLYGDTIIDGKTCKMLGRSEMEASPGGIYSPIDTVFVGALYEEGRKVYGANSDMNHLELLYDFVSSVGADVTISGNVFTVIRKEQSKDAAYKGELTYIQLSEDEEAMTFWMEGVGGLSHPLESLVGLYPTGLHNEQLLSCYVGDEAIYLRRDWNDPIDPEVKKQWLDFTHTVKPRPKSPRKKESGLTPDPGLTPCPSPVGEGSNVGEGNLTGEYSDKDLLVSLVPLQGPYTVTLTDAAGKEVYVKTVQTSSVVALNTDLSKYPAGSYTLTVENADEAYTASLSIGEGNGIKEIGQSDNLQLEKGHSSIFNPHSSIYYDLSGRRLSAPPAKGMYIQDKRVKIKE